MKRNKKRIKNKSDLPKWFQIGKYEEAKHLDAAGWYEQLNIRIESEVIIDLHLDGTDHEFINETQDFKEVIELIRQNPIVNISSNDKLSVYFSFAVLKKLSLGIHPLTAEEFIILKKSIDSKKLKLLQECLDSPLFFKHPTKDQVYEPILNLVTNKSSTPHQHVAYIDWDLPDTLLLEHFKQYLANHRPEKNEQIKRFKKFDFENWCHFGVLPYLDLRIWVSENNLTIPNRVIADAIFPDGEQGEETIRKTTIPLAESLLTNEMLQLLASKASLDKTEKNSN